MILALIGTGLYPEFVGRRALIVGSATGPTSYSQTTGDVVSLTLPNWYIDAIAGEAQTVSGTYIVRFRPAGTGPRQAWSAHWYATSGGAEVSNAVDLSAEKIQVGAFVGQF